MLTVGDTILTSMTALRARAYKCVLLYSGGLDSTYLLKWATDNGLDICALHIGVNGSDTQDTRLETVTQRLGVDYRYEEHTDKFVNEYVSRAINADARCDGIFPVSSSLSRPLMAKVAVEVAAHIGADTIVHTAAPHQNSCQRFNNALMSLAPDLLIGNPYLRDDIPREEKLRLLNMPEFTSESIYSIDSNIWARVVENGELDSVRNPVPSHIFKWTVAPKDAAGRDDRITISFARGIPVALNGVEKSLLTIISELNHRAGQFGIGRFNGLENTCLGVKNHEVREAPAAYVILEARRHLEQAVLTSEELRIKQFVSAEWTRWIIAGGWYSDVAELTSTFISNLAAFVEGDVEIVLQPGSAYINSIYAPRSLGMETDMARVVLSQRHASKADSLRHLRRSMLI